MKNRTNLALAAVAFAIPAFALGMVTGIEIADSNDAPLSNSSYPAELNKPYETQVTVGGKTVSCITNGHGELTCNW